MVGKLKIVVNRSLLGTNPSLYWKKKIKKKGNKVLKMNIKKKNPIILKKIPRQKKGFSSSKMKNGSWDRCTTFFQI